MKLPFIATILLALFACSSHSKKPLEPAFFCWETTLSITPDERSLQDSLGCKKLYIKILDIGLNPDSGEIEPYSRTEMSDSTELKGLKIIPTIFITNEVFQNISEEKTVWLAGKITAAAAITGAFDELLFDCDWTSTTRDAFFHFLKKMREKLPPGIRISATIRLHQYKSPQKTGVPPVDRGMLMFYNTGDVDRESEQNTIFYPDDALKYLDGTPKNYPIPLDLALPLFSWGLVFREGELWKIVPGPLPIVEMRSNGKWIESPGTEPFASRLWEVKAGTFLGGHYLRPGDHLRISEISPVLLFKAANLAQKLDLADDATLAFFHLNIARSAHFSAQLLDIVCKTVRK
jgi:hypothetical protein